MEMERSFFAELCAANAATHHACLEHPVVVGIGHGELPESAFRSYIEQDFLFLRAYVRVLARAVAASPTLDDATMLAELLHATLTVEIEALRALYASFDGDPGALDAGSMSATTRAYTDHLLATSAEGSLPLILSSILPCQWGYREIGHHLAARGLPADPRYAGWISEYTSDEYGALVDRIIARFDVLSCAASSTERARCHDVFAVSSTYERAFWAVEVSDG